MGVAALSRARVLQTGFVAIALAVPLLLARDAGAQVSPKQAVVETSLGTFVFDLTPEAAPNQVAYFMKVALEGRLRRHDVPHDVPERDGPGRRSAVERSSEARGVRHRRSERRESRGARAKP